MTWQPIETAPKDGTEVILWVEFEGAIIGKWDWIAYLYNYYWISKEAYEKAENFDCYFGVTPTHWMPLPPDPNQ